MSGNLDWNRHDGQLFDQLGNPPVQIHALTPVQPGHRHRRKCLDLPFISRIRNWLGIEREFHAASGKKATCINRYGGKTSGLDAHFALVGAHFLSSGIVSFARGLNDTPKIAAVLILAPAFNAITGL